MTTSIRYNIGHTDIMRNQPFIVLFLHTKTAKILHRSTILHKMIFKIFYFHFLKCHVTLNHYIHLISGYIIKMT